MTTAAYRNEAHEAAATLNWNRAAQLLDLAIANYPTRGALADRDISRMAALAASYRNQAKQA